MELFLRELIDWLESPDMSKWTYIEGGDFYADRDAWAKRLRAVADRLADGPGDGLLNDGGPRHE